MKLSSETPLILVQIAEVDLDSCLNHQLLRRPAEGQRGGSSGWVLWMGPVDGSCGRAPWKQPQTLALISDELPLSNQLPIVSTARASQRHTIILSELTRIK